MATESLCKTFFSDRDYSCLRNFISKFYQEAVLIRKRDILTLEKAIPTEDSVECEYSITDLVLREGLTGFRIKIDASSNAIKGYFSKSKDDKNMTQYIHRVDILAAGVSEEDMCNLDALDHDTWVVALQALDGTVVIYGADNGLTTGDYDYDIVADSGSTVITLESDENAPERYLPLVYFNTDEETTTERFDNKFEAPVA